MVEITELLRNGCQALKTMTYFHFNRHAHAAMQLDGIQARLASELARQHLGSRYEAAALCGLACGHRHRGGTGHGLQLLQCDGHVGHPVLEHLELGQGHAELLAGAQMVGGMGQQGLDRARGFSAQGGDGGIQGRFHRVGGFTARAQHAVGRHQGVVEGDMGGAAAVQGVIALHRHAGGDGVHGQDGQPAAVAGVARGAPNWPDLGCQ